MSDRVELLTAGSGNGPAKRWSGGRGTFMVSGTFDGATAKLQVLGPDGATYLDLGAPHDLSAPGVTTFDLAQATIRLAVNGAGAGTSLDGVAVRIG